jgi:hypothetical protein
MDRKAEESDVPRPLGERLKRALFREPAVILLERGPDQAARNSVERRPDYAA